MRKALEFVGDLVACAAVTVLVAGYMLGCAPAPKPAAVPTTAAIEGGHPELGDIARALARLEVQLDTLRESVAAGRRQDREAERDDLEKAMASVRLMVEEVKAEIARRR